MIHDAPLNDEKTIIELIKQEDNFAFYDAFQMKHDFT